MKGPSANSIKAEVRSENKRIGFARATTIGIRKTRTGCNEVSYLGGDELCCKMAYLQVHH
jgi:hypothetical protein